MSTTNDDFWSSALSLSQYIVLIAQRMALRLSLRICLNGLIWPKSFFCNESLLLFILDSALFSFFFLGFCTDLDREFIHLTELLFNNHVIMHWYGWTYFDAFIISFSIYWFPGWPNCHSI